MRTFYLRIRVYAIQKKRRNLLYLFVLLLLPRIYAILINKLHISITNKSNILIKFSFNKLDYHNAFKLGNCIPLTVSIVPLKPQNFRKNRRTKISKFPVYFRYAFDRQKLANFDK